MPTGLVEAVPGSTVPGKNGHEYYLANASPTAIPRGFSGPEYRPPAVSSSGTTLSRLWSAHPGASDCQPWPERFMGKIEPEHGSCSLGPGSRISLVVLAIEYRKR